MAYSFIITVILLLTMIAFLIIRQCAYHKRISEMNAIIERILEGEKKLQIFSKKEAYFQSVS